MNGFNLAGQIFGRLTVTPDFETRGPRQKRRYWRCVCQCGKETWVQMGNLTSGNTTSCGCFHRELTSVRSCKGPTDFWAKVQKLPNGCWLWLGSRNKRYGYFTRKAAHKYAYELMIGPVPDGLELDHLCRNRYCVNPHHLEAVSHRVNMLRGSLPKLTYDQAVQVALRRMRGEKSSVIARGCGIGASTVRDIAKGRKWKDARITAAFLFDLEKES